MPAPARAGLFWDPHQKLWNRRLVAVLYRAPRPVAKAALAVVVLLDSSLLLVRAAAHLLAAVRRTGLRAPRIGILYIDCGTHKDGSEITVMHRWFGARKQLRVLAFEASPRHYASAAAKLAPLGIDLRQVALVGPDYADDSVRLYHSSGDGRGDSLFDARGEVYDEVTATRLSTILSDEKFALSSSATILRMNIEGAEEMVIDDLAESGLIGQFDGFYGMWDDLGKIDPARAATFDQRLHTLGIESFPFNERDLRVGLRRLAVHLDLLATIRLAAAAKAG